MATCAIWRTAAAAGNARARLALDVFVAGIRNYLGALLVELGGADVIVFTGGIGENGVNIRTAVCAGLDELGIELDPASNASGPGRSADQFSRPAARRCGWCRPTKKSSSLGKPSKRWNRPRQTVRKARDAKGRPPAI